MPGAAFPKDMISVLTKRLPLPAKKHLTLKEE
jgi:hypothetical protein